ncbi:MAG: TIGR02996 domain-containing protein [Planctomycetes bacterium]|nr:TIGR02996 domain-containing protein [Planctomycetota bacterium]
MNDRLAFLRAIRANPDDDTARLVFADWLDEHNDPLGEFIRVQIELEPIRYRVDNSRALELHRREEELLRAHGDDWIGKAKKIGADWPEYGPQFRRGLPNHANLSLDALLKHGRTLFSACPTLRELTVFGIATRGAELAACPHLAKLDILEIADWPTEEDAKALAASSHIKQISHFKIWLGGESEDHHFPNELMQRATDDWPRDVELVQLLNDRGSFWATIGTLNRLKGSKVRVSRPCDMLFPLDGDLGYNMRAGRLPDGRAALAAGSFGDWVLVIFHKSGLVKKATKLKSSVGVGKGFDALEKAVTNWMDKKLRLKPELIWVKEFFRHGLGVHLWSDPRLLADPRPDPPDRYTHISEWRSRGGDARQWYEHRNFVIYWFNNYHADWRGAIHSS